MSPSRLNPAEPLEALEISARTFAEAKTQRERLWALFEYMDAVLGLLETFPVTLPMLAPHNALSQALATMADGGPHPLLAKAERATRPVISPARIVDRVVAVLASELFHRGGMQPGQADAASAKLVSSLGVEGAPNKRLSAKTVTKWRSHAGKTGDHPEVGAICSEHLKDIPLKLSPASAAEAARAFAVSFLATRYQIEDSPEG